MTHRVVALVCEGVIPLELAIPSRVFADPSLEVANERAYSFGICGERPGLVMTSEGFAISVPSGMDALKSADTIVLPGYSHPDHRLGGPALDALRSACAAGVRFVAISTGARLIADAGATAMARSHTPPIPGDLRDMTGLNCCGETGLAGCNDPNLLIAAGAAAAMDLCLTVIRNDHGVAVSNSLARRLLGPQRSAGQPQFIEVSGSDDANPALERLRAWIGSNLSRPLTIKAMAAYAQMSERHFARRFVDETGVSPLQWLLQRRILLARELLETSNLSVKQVAARAGFGSTMAFRDQFKRRTGSTPVPYRDAFRRHLMAPSACIPRAH